MGSVYNQEKGVLIMEDLGMEFEDFMRFTILNALHPSPSKQVAMENNFYHFADIVRPVVKKAPEEFKGFMNELEKRMQNVERWRAPRGTVVAVALYHDNRKDSAMEIDKWPNGRPRYKLWKK
jgi:hypothetical protein